MGGYQLGSFFIFIDVWTIFFAGFVVKDLEVYSVAALLDLTSDVVGGGKAVAVVPGEERFD